MRQYGPDGTMRQDAVLLVTVTVVGKKITLSAGAEPAWVEPQREAKWPKAEIVRVEAQLAAKQMQAIKRGTYE